MNDNYYDILKEMVDVLDAYEGNKELFSCQCQSMDGYTALANFIEIAKNARRVIAN